MRNGADFPLYTPAELWERWGSYSPHRHGLKIDKLPKYYRDLLKERLREFSRFEILDLGIKERRRVYDSRRPIFVLVRVHYGTDAEKEKVLSVRVSEFGRTEKVEANGVPLSGYAQIALAKAREERQFFTLA